MTSAVQEAKLKFLEIAAQTYASISPPTSAHLMLQRDAEVSSLGQARHAKASASCKACGTMLLPGLTAKKTIEGSEKAAKGSDRSRSKRRKSMLQTGEQSSQKWVRVDCLTCHHYTKISLDLVQRRKYNSRQTSAVQHADETGTTSANQASSSKSSNPNTSSKRRAKARKHGGLSAMLEKAKGTSPASPGFGLDLMDFMQQY